MKFKAKFILFIFCVLFSSVIFSQTIDHPSINKLEVSYKESNITDTIIKYKVQTNISFKSDSSISIIHLKIFDVSDNSMVYLANYPTSIPLVSDENGIALFKKEIKSCLICTSIELPLKLYLYQITTEDTEGNETEVYSEFK